MLKQDVLSFFGGVNATARAMGVGHSAVSQWPDELSPKTSALCKEKIKEVRGGAKYLRELEAV